MNLSRLFVIHAFITLLAGIVLIISPGLIPATVNITLQPNQYLLCYFLGAAEIAIAYLSFHSRKVSDPKTLNLLVNTFIVFHLATAAVEIYDYLQGGSIKLWANVLLRVIISLLFLFFLRKSKR